MRQSRRRDQITEKIENFIASKTTDPLALSLYSRDIKYLAELYPQLVFVKGDHVNNTDRVICTISKKDE